MTGCRNSYEVTLVGVVYNVSDSYHASESITIYFLNFEIFVAPAFIKPHAIGSGVVCRNALRSRYSHYIHLESLKFKPFYE